MRHVYRCPVRWADLDLLGHVTNAVYIDYLQEARVDLMRVLRGGGDLLGPAVALELTDGVVVVRHEVTYLTPLLFGHRPVDIECWVTDIRAGSFTMAYEIFHDDPDLAGGRRVYVRATTVLAPFVFAEERPRRLTARERERLAPYLEPPTAASAARIPPLDRSRAHLFQLQVRFSDVDVYRHVNNVKYVEYFQEARIAMVRDVIHGSGLRSPSTVVAQTDVEYRRPVLLRSQPYEVWSDIVRVGTRSMTLESEICDGEEVLARSRVTVVFFDSETGRSAEPDPSMRDLLTSRVAPTPAATPAS